MLRSQYQELAQQNQEYKQEIELLKKQKLDLEEDSKRTRQSMMEQLSQGFMQSQRLPEATGRPQQLTVS